MRIKLTKTEIEELINKNILQKEELKWDSEQELRVLLDEIRRDPNTVAWLIRGRRILVLHWKISF